MSNQEKKEEEVGAEAIIVPLNYNDRTYRQRIEEIRADKDKIKKATESLKRLGFTIAADGVISITIFGKKELFEDIFHIKLSRTLSRKDIDNRKNSLSLKSSSNCYVSDSGVKIPKELEGLVYDIVFGMEPTFM